MRWAAVVLLGLLAGVPLQAQMPGGGGEDGDAPAMAMGNGRVVRGTVTATAKDKLTVKSEEGETYQVVVTDNTRVRKGRDALKFADVHAGDGVGAMGVLDAPNKTVHAVMLVVVDAADIKKGREAMGKTFIWGRVTAIHELQLTVLREDKVSQVITVDEDTSFKRGRGMRGNGFGTGAADSPANAESITLGDVKVGDIVAGPGALKAGMFVPKELLVGDPTVRRRRGADGAASASGNAANGTGGPQ